MTPAAVTEPLARLRRRQRAIAAAWGVACWLGVTAAALAVACAIDWWVDLRRDTPPTVRLGLAAVQCVIASIAAVAWIITPALRRRPDDEVALFVESQRPELSHRLISAVQLNRRGADRRGISAELIEQVTAEATRAAGRIDFPALADHRRLRRAARLAGGVVIIVAAAFAIAPQTLTALVRRQLLAEVLVPRRITLADRTAAVQPAAEPVTLRFAVGGDGPYAGEVRIAPDDGPAERVAVTAEPRGGEIAVTLPAPPGDFAFEAWLGDGRLPAPGRVALVPRPAVTELTTALILPPFVGRRSDGSPFETPLPRGEITGIAGCAARVIARTQKPVVAATLELLGPGDPLSAAPPRLMRTQPMTITASTHAAATFDLRPDEAAFRVVVRDTFGFANLDPPRRDVRLVPEEPPTVTLLPEQFRPVGFTGAGEEFEVEGVPVPLGGAVRIAYAASHPYGLGKAFLGYRVVETQRSEGDGQPAEARWQRLPLTETPTTADTGPFDPRRGCFLHSRPADQVQFHAAASPEPDRRPGRLDGGGRFDFQTRGLAGVRPGDTIEYFVEVTNRDPANPLAGRSETRAKKVVTVAELVAWIDATLRQEDRIRRLADRQRGVFDK